MGKMLEAEAPPRKFTGSVIANMFGSGWECLRVAIRKCGQREETKRGQAPPEISTSVILYPGVRLGNREGYCLDIHLSNTLPGSAAG